MRLNIETESCNSMTNLMATLEESWPP